jgi:hypothetical protein
MYRGRHLWRSVTRWFAAASALVLCAWPVSANAIASAHYQIQEDFLGGAGSSIGAASPSYQIQSTSGATAIGDSAGTSYKTQSGATTTSDPALSFSVTNPSVNLGALTNASATTTSTTFNVLNYTSYGYVVTMLGTPPSNGAHTLTALSAGGTSTPGTEQFGINLVLNSVLGVGANPAQVPDSTFSFGSAASGYNTGGTFKYNSGDTIAQATKTSGQTTYTISYLANISKFTPPGSYSGAETLICTGTY